MDHPSWTSRISGLALLLPVALVLLFHDLGARFFATNDETRFPMLARDILARGDWLWPRLNGSPYLNKPPLFAWLIAAASWPGAAVTPVTAALPSLLAALGLVHVTWWIGQRLFGATAGIMAGLVVLTMDGVFLLARVPMPDMTMTLALTGAMAMFILTEWGASRAWLVAFYAATGLAVWTKGPVGLLPLAVVLVYTLAVHGRPSPARLVSVPGLILLALALGSWWLLRTVGADDQVGRQMAAQDVLAWYLPTAGFEWRALYRPPVGAATILLPWTVFVPFAVWFGARGARGDGGRQRARTLLLIWAGIAFVLIGLSAQQRMRYWLPLCPPVAVLLAAWFADLPGLRRRAAVFATIWIIGAGGLVAWRAKDVTHRQAETDLSGLARELRARPAPVYAVDLQELVLAFHLETPVAQSSGSRGLERSLAGAGPRYVVVADHGGNAPIRTTGVRRVAEGRLNGGRFFVLAKD